MLAAPFKSPTTSQESDFLPRPGGLLAFSGGDQFTAAIDAISLAGQGCRDRKLQRAVFTLTARAATLEHLHDEDETAHLIAQAQVVASAALATGYEDLVVASTRLVALLAADPDREPFARDRRGTSGLGPKILVIHPDSAFQEELAAVLATLGYRVMLEADGGAGLARVRIERPSLVICALDLPLTPGEVVILSLRLDPATADLPIVVLTGDLHRLGPEHHVEAVLQPPIPLDDLAATVELFAPLPNR